MISLERIQLETIHSSGFRSLSVSKHYSVQFISKSGPQRVTERNCCNTFTTTRDRKLLGPESLIYSFANILFILLHYIYIISTITKILETNQNKIFEISLNY